MLNPAASGSRPVAVPSARVFGLALSVSLVLHGAFALFLWLQPSSQRPHAPQAAPASLVVEFGAAASAADASPPALSAQPSPAPSSEPRSVPVAPIEQLSQAAPPLPGLMHARYQQSPSAPLPQLEMDLATTVATATLDIPLPASPAPRLQMSEAEQRMLAARIEQWSENPELLLAEDELLRWEFEGREYRAAASRVLADSATARDRIRVEIMTERDGLQWQSAMELTRLSFSHYAQFINFWDPNVYLSQDEVAGRFHSNTAVNISTDRRYRPRFSGPVTIAATQHQAVSLSRSGVFEAGVETRVSALALPSDDHPFDLFTTSDGEPHRFTENSRIVFHADASYSWQGVGENSLLQRRALGSEPVYLLAEPGVELFIEGTVAGQVLVFAPRRITITGDLRYAADPRRERRATQLLSVISGHTIQIAEPAVTGAGDLTIEGALFARQRFSVRNFRQRGNGALLSVYGSLIAGSVSATEPRYATRVEYDPRFDHLRPPGFPMTMRHALSAQDDFWQLAAHQP